jgi:hypothetical protein
MQARADASGGEAGRVRLHLAMGWCLLSLFVVLGMALEGMHAFKLGWFLDLANETRRLLLRLAHAHGVLLGLVNVGFALSLAHRAPCSERVEVWISRCILLGSALLPAGFLLGGLVVLEGDPNPAILLAAIGAPLLLAGVLGATWSFLSAGPRTGRDRSGQRNGPPSDPAARI